MKRKIVLSDREIASIISELELSIDSTSDYNQCMYLSSIISKLRNSSDSYFHIIKPHSPNKPLTAMER